jgi:serine/threonine-protein kinase
MASKPPCPAPSDLKRMLDGELPDAEQTGVSRHLDTCLACQQQLQELAADEPSWDALAGHLRSGSGSRGAALQQAIDELCDAAISLATQSGLEGGEENSFPFLDPTAKPRQLGKLHDYEIIEKIGRGGMGIVFKALDPGLHRIVAIKVMATQLAAVPSARQRFTREAKATAAVCHEHIVTIHAVGETKGLPYFVMQFVGGVSLQERLEKRGPLSLDAILRIGMQTAQGLGAAHAQGLVHRDIKPANILLENGVERVKITDFGLARAASDASLTQSGVIVGTPQYMAPEQARGEAVDPRSDLFSLGSVLYFMCTGQEPFRGISSLAVIRRVCEEKPPPIQEVNPNIPDWLVEIIARLQAKEPTDRFQSAAEVAELLNQHLLHLQRAQPFPVPSGHTNGPAAEGEAVRMAVPVQLLHEPRKSRWSKPLALVAAMSLLAFLATMALLFRFNFPSSSSEPNPTEVGNGESHKTDSPARQQNPEQLREHSTDHSGHEESTDGSTDSIPVIPASNLNGSQVEVALSEPFAQVCTGGGGRYLVFHLKKAQKLAIFDVAAVKVVKVIDLPPGDVVYACGREKLMLVLPGQGIIQRYDLRTFERETMAHVPDERPVLRAVMGCNSPGPLVLWTGGKVVFFDIERMERQAVEGALLSGETQFGLELRVSADGQTFVGWTPGIHPMQYSVMRLNGRKAVMTRTPEAQSFNGHWAMPAADGSLIFRSGPGLHSGNRKITLGDGFNNAVLLPTEDRRFFLALRRQTKDKDHVTICATADRRALLTVRNIEKFTDDPLYTRWGLIGDQPRIHYLHSAQVLLELPESNNRVVIRPLDLFATLESEGKSYLFVLSVPRTRVRAGTIYDYPLDVRSKAGGVHYLLEARPEGMTVSPDGRLRWEVPANKQGKTVPVIVTIRDASRKDIQHTFEITVE